MCRLALFNEKFARDMRSSLLPFMNDLQKRQGGQGQGVAVCYDLDSRVPYVMKGVKVKNERLMKVINYALDRQQPEYFIYHTRIAVSGLISDENSMPFVRGNTVVAHNGMEEEITSDNVYGHSDTDCLSLLLSYGMPFKNLASDGMTGTYVGWIRGFPFVVKNTEWSDLQLAVNEDQTSWIFASVLTSLKTKLLQKGYSIWDVPPISWNGYDIDVALRRCAGYDWKKTYYNYHSWELSDKNPVVYEQDLSKVDDLTTFRTTSDEYWIQYKNDGSYKAMKATPNQYVWLEENGYIK